MQPIIITVDSTDHVIMTKEEFQNHIREAYEQGRQDAAPRTWEMPPMSPSQPSTPYQPYITWTSSDFHVGDSEGGTGRIIASSPSTTRVVLNSTMLQGVPHVSSDHD